MEAQALVEKFKEYFENYSLETLDQCADFYHEDLCFVDPFHKIYGRDRFVDYSRRLMKKVHGCRFEIHKVFFDDGVVDTDSDLGDEKISEACIVWTMHVKPSSFQDETSVHGSTHLKIKDKIYMHRDYFDTAEMIYKKIPVLSGVIKAIEKRVVS